MTTWTLIRFVHLTAMAFFVGGQLMLVFAVVPVVRDRGGDETTMRAVARRFGIASAIALAVLIATGAAMASHYQLWDDPTLQAKLAVLVLVAVFTGLHIAAPEHRAVAYAVVAASLVIVWLGVKLTHG